MAVALPDNDGALVRLAIEGNTEAFSVLYERYFPPVIDFLTRLLREREEAADVAQDTFIKAIEELPRIRDPESFKSWLFTIAHRQGLNRIRSSKRARVGVAAAIDDEERATMAVADPDPTVDPEAMATSQETANIVWEAAAGLEPRTYAVMDLHVRQGLGSAEIAEVIGVSKANAYTMVSRMKRTFSTTLATYLLVRKGRDDCEGLAKIVPVDIEELTPSLRRKADRHVAKCGACAENRRMLVAPIKTFAGLMLVPAPAGLKAAVWEAVGTGAAAGAGAAVAAQAGGGGAALAGTGSAAVAAASAGGTAAGVLSGVSGWVTGVTAAVGLATAALVGNAILTGDDEEIAAGTSTSAGPFEAASNRSGDTASALSEDLEGVVVPRGVVADGPSSEDTLPTLTDPSSPPTTVSPPPTTAPPWITTTTTAATTTTTVAPPSTTAPPRPTTTLPPTSTLPPPTSPPPPGATTIPPSTTNPPPLTILPPLPEATILVPLAVAPPLLCVLPAIVNAEVLNPGLARLTVRAEYVLRSGGTQLDSGAGSMQSVLPVIPGLFTFPLSMGGNNQARLDVTIRVTDQSGTLLDQAAMNNVAVSCL